MQSEPNSLIRSHRERVQKANSVLRENSMYKEQPISKIDREAFVECLLLEDIADLFQARLKEEKAIEPENQSEAQKKAENIKKYEDMRNLFDDAAEAAIAAINAGNYKAVWQAIPETALMVAAKRADKFLPELWAMGCEIVRRLEKSVLS